MKTVFTELIQNSSTLFLKVILIGLGAGVLALTGLLLYAGIFGENLGPYRYILFGICLTSIPFFIGLINAFKILIYIDRNQAFSILSLNALRRIKFCAIGISALYLAGSPYIYWVAELDDAPGVILINLILIAAPFAIAVFGEILIKLLRSAIEYKTENELTV
ncbi:MAG: DUF2975 domain-containing protein [Brumimicrobium sp.]|nr:DUF2975 domain-containing protein [Brumimicrobium sp.]